MGCRLPYPTVPDTKIHEIYKQSLCQPIHAYGFFVDLLALYNRKRGRPDSPDIDAADDVSRFLWDVEMELLAAGLHKLSIASVPTPKQFHTIYSGDEGWLVILGTGFDMTPHVPIPSEITERVRNIFKAEEPPGWWSMRWFTYPAPKLWIKHQTKHIQEAEG